ncbi:MAG TPA: hypothetical protein VE131_08310 [Terriglobales bacterium]|nr:hypothetical protein [Terriglobales bacterium]
MEWLKNISDKLFLWFLYATSGYGKELTRDGRAEQIRWREQRLRNLEGLSLRSHQRFETKKDQA